MTRKNVLWRSHPDSGPIQFGPAKTCAGGVPAITSSLQHAFGEMGLMRSLRTLSRVNQKQGFDCPGCAWPDPDGHRALTEFCENGVKAVAEEATLKRLTPEIMATRTVAAWSELSDMELGKLGRLTAPMWLPPGADHYQPLSWDEALDRIAEKLKTCSSANEAVFYTSGRTSNEAAFLYQLFVRAFGTNNLPDCSNMCHESSGFAMKESVGIGKGTVTLEDFDKADCILVIGQNPGTNHPRMLSSLQAAKRNGAKILAVNPLREAGLLAFQHPQYPQEWIGKGTELATRFLQVSINGDVALLKGLQKALLTMDQDGSEGVLDRDFIAQYCDGFDAFASDAQRWSWPTITQQSGLDQDAITAAAEDLATSKRIIACWAMGLTQHENAVANIQEITNLMLMLGQIGSPGAGLCPVRGHSNVQGDRTMGIWEKPSREFLDALETQFKFSPPSQHGYDVVEAIEAMAAGNVRILFCMGGNFLSATPDTEMTAKALNHCDMTVQVSTKLNRSHLVVGREAIILPCLGRTDRDNQASGPQFVSVEDSMGVVRKSQGRLPPPSEHLLSEASIVCQLAKRVLPFSEELPWNDWQRDYDLVRNAIEKTIPGFADYNVRVRKPDGFYLPNPVRDNRTFNTVTGKARFIPHPIPDTSLREGEWLLMTMRSHDQYNTTIYGLQDRYRGIRSGRYVLFMSPADMQSAGFKTNEKVRVTSHYDRERVAEDFRVIPLDLPKRCLAGYFPELNVLVPLGLRAYGSNTPASKSIKVRVAVTP